ncbi:MAG TPA: GntR family transcriptional regulator [Devosiaceae bacterium]
MPTGLKLRASDLGKTASSSDVIYDALRDAIIRGQVAEGDVLRQDSIAQMFNVSRIPVREALKRLEAHGLVTSTRYKGVVVTPMSIAEISEIFEFRSLIEPRVLEIAVPQMTEASLQLAQGYCDAFAAETSPERWGDLNRQFHSALYRDARRPYYLSVIDATNDRIDRYVRAQLELTHGMARARRDHQAIMDACLAGDAATAAAQTREHIVNAGKSLVAFLEGAGR